MNEQGTDLAPAAADPPPEKAEVPAGGREIEATAAAAVLAALDRAAEQHLNDNRPYKTRVSYERDWALWEEFHGWLAERTGIALPLTTFTVGTMVGFVTWLDRVQRSAPSTIERRLTGVAVTARTEHRIEIPKAVSLAARQALKPLKLDDARRARGRGKAVATTPEHLAAIAAAPAAKPTRPGGRRTVAYAVPEIARLRDMALTTLGWGIAGRVSHLSALRVEHVTLEAEGLRVRVPAVKGLAGHTVVVGYATDPAMCPVRCWLAWIEAAGLVEGPAFRAVDQVGRIGEGLSPNGCCAVITRVAERAGIEVRLTGHSQRAGLITTAIRARKRPDKVREVSGHAPNSAVFWEYVRDASAWDDAATVGLL